MNMVFSESEVFLRETEIISKTALKPDSYIALVDSLYTLYESNQQLLISIAKRNNVKPTYFFGKLNYHKLINNLVKSILPTITRLNSLEIMYFVIAYEDGFIDILEDAMRHFELPDESVLVGAYEREADAEHAMLDYDLLELI